ncbi:MAG TPA: nuclear transport factor 2 family protein [Solirubrobacteraceae bacterium]|nr:nuclear transport factor 2 family protein [Solirubrobacteraceae bacterium]
MSTANTNQVDLFYKAVAAGDLPTALGFLGDVEWHEAHGMPYRAERPYRGAAEIADRVLGPINFDVEDLSLAVDRIFDLGNHVAVLGRYTGIARASRDGIDQPFVHVWTLDDEGVLREFRQYTDGPRFADALAR